MGGALARRPEGAGTRATLAGDHTMFAVGGVMTPDAYDEVLGQASGVATALRPGTPALRQLPGGVGDARLFYDEDTYRLLRAIRTVWDPSGLFLANHEI